MATVFNERDVQSESFGTNALRARLITKERVKGATAS